jgi:ATP-binding protein involved in chromosome partitioning
LEFLGEIPLTIKLRETSDAGTPITAIEPDNKVSQSFKIIAETVWNKVQIAARPAPKITVVD